MTQVAVWVNYSMQKPHPFRLLPKFADPRNYGNLFVQRSETTEQFRCTQAGSSKVLI